jgi:hypothetical protein
LFHHRSSRLPDQSGRWWSNTLPRIRSNRSPETALRTGFYVVLCVVFRPYRIVNALCKGSSFIIPYYISNYETLGSGGFALRPSTSCFGLPGRGLALAPPSLAAFPPGPGEYTGGRGFYRALRRGTLTYPHAQCFACLSVRGRRAKPFESSPGNNSGFPFGKPHFGEWRIRPALANRLCARSGPGFVLNRRPGGLPV